MKTDCFTIRASDLSRAQHLLSFDSGIGSWRVSKKGDGIICPYDGLTVRQLKDFRYSKVVSKRLKVKDEWDTSEICDLSLRRRSGSWSERSSLAAVSRTPAKP